MNRGAAKDLAEKIFQSAKDLLVRDDSVMPVAFPFSGGEIDGVIPLQPIFDVTQMALEKAGPAVADIFIKNLWTGLRITLKENNSDGIIVVAEGNVKRCDHAKTGPTFADLSPGDGRNVVTVWWKFRLDNGERVCGTRIQFFKRSAGGEVMLEEDENCDTELEGPLKEMLE